MSFFLIYLLFEIKLLSRFFFFVIEYGINLWLTISSRVLKSNVSEFYLYFIVEISSWPFCWHLCWRSGVCCSLNFGGNFKFHFLILFSRIIYDPLSYWKSMKIWILTGCFYITDNCRDIWSNCFIWS